MKCAYSPQACTRSSPKLAKYAASVKPAARKQLWNAAVRIPPATICISPQFHSAINATGRGRARKPVENTVLLSVLVQQSPGCHTGRGLSPHCNPTATINYKPREGALNH